MNSTKKAAWINGLFLIITLIVNALGAFGLISGYTQKEISDMYLSLITPSPFAFSIWGLIYSLLFISIIVMIVKYKDPYYQKAIEKISFLFRFSCALNILWIITFSFILIEVSVLFIFALTITLALICQQILYIHEKKRWLLPLTFGLYAGWLIIATVVNIAAALVKLNWNGFGIADNIWAAVMLIASIFLVIAVQSKNRNAVFPLPVAWAYFGINRFLKSPQGFNGDYLFLQALAIAGMLVLIGVAAIRFYINKFAILPDSKRK